MHQIALRYTTNFIFSFFLMLREDCYMDRKGLYFEKHFYIQIKFFVFRENVNKQRLFIAILKKIREFKFQTT